MELELLKIIFEKNWNIDDYTKGYWKTVLADYMELYFLDKVDLNKTVELMRSFIIKGLENSSFDMTLKSSTPKLPSLKSPVQLETKTVLSPLKSSISPLKSPIRLETKHISPLKSPISPLKSPVQLETKTVLPSLKSPDQLETKTVLPPLKSSTLPPLKSPVQLETKTVLPPLKLSTSKLPSLKSDIQLETKSVLPPLKSSQTKDFYSIVESRKKK